jgi:hypothetical protein
MEIGSLVRDKGHNGNPGYLLLAARRSTTTTAHATEAQRNRLMARSLAKLPSKESQEDEQEEKARRDPQRSDEHGEQVMACSDCLGGGWRKEVYNCGIYWLQLTRMRTGNIAVWCVAREAAKAM